MVGGALLLVFSIFLFKSFYKTSVIILIWQLILMHVSIGENYTVYSLLGYVELLAFSKQVVSKEIKWKYVPFLSGYLLVLLSFLLAGFECKIGVVGGILSMFILPLTFWLSKDKIEDWTKFVITNLCILMFPIVIIGLLELILGYNPVGLWLEVNGIMNLAEVSEDYVRFGMMRCRSLTAWCSTYGVLCGYTLITLLFATYYNIVKQKAFIYILSLLLFVGVLSTGTRSVYLSVAIGLLPLVLLYSSKMKYIIGLFAICIVVYLFNETLIDAIIDSFVNHEDADGSSVEMRESQYDAAYEYFARNPIFGNGIGYVSIAMQQSPKLLGAESCIFIIMIDRGVFGFIAYGILNIQLLIYLLKKSRYRMLVFIPIGILVGKLISAFIDIGELYPIMWLAIIIQIIDQAKNKKHEISRNNNRLQIA